MTSIPDIASTTWFNGCEGCGRLHARITRLCLACELEREAAMAHHPSSTDRTRHGRTIRAHRRGAA
jgi:hypothetical protein